MPPGEGGFVFSVEVLGLVLQLFPDMGQAFNCTWCRSEGTCVPASFAKAETCDDLVVPGEECKLPSAWVVGGRGCGGEIGG